MSNTSLFFRYLKWFCRTLRLCVEEVRDPRSVAVNRNGQPTVVDVANAIFVTDSGEQVKSVFWDEEFHKFYHKLKPKMVSSVMSRFGWAETNYTCVFSWSNSSTFKQRVPIETSNIEWATCTSN